jgi:membrane protein implicated in regulation of membrane protease activity
MTRPLSGDIDLQRAKHLFRLRNAIAVAALILMALQVLAANGIFAWYGLAGGWDVPFSAVTAWMGTTVIEVVSVVLVIVNYLFPVERRKYA